MPEGPVLQALAERLTPVVVGSTLTAIVPLQFSAIKTVQPPPEHLVGRELTAVTHRGKYLIFVFAVEKGATDGADADDGDVGEDGGEDVHGDAADRPRLVIHLWQAGRLRIEQPAKTSRPKRGVLRLTFGEIGLQVFEFGTERGAGWWVLDAGDAGPLADLGPEPDDAAFTAYLADNDDDNRWLHTMLRDQRTVAGIGRGHADDILHRARLSPFVSLASLDADQRGRLQEAVTTELAAGLEAERARDAGLPNKLGDHWRVHNRHGQACPTCGDELRRVSFESYEITYCPDCQTDGKVLSDRRLSKLLK